MAIVMQRTLRVDTRSYRFSALSTGLCHAISDYMNSEYEMVENTQYKNRAVFSPCFRILRTILFRIAFREYKTLA